MRKPEGWIGIFPFVLPLRSPSVAPSLPHLSWPRLIAADIAAVNELAEEVIEQWMPDRLAAGIGLKILLGRVGILGGPVHENMIPGLALNRLRLVRLIPVLVGRARKVAFDDDAPVSVSLMADELSTFKLRRNLGKSYHDDDSSRSGSARHCGCKSYTVGQSPTYFRQKRRSDIATEGETDRGPSLRCFVVSRSLSGRLQSLRRFFPLLTV